MEPPIFNKYENFKKDVKRVGEVSLLYLFLQFQLSFFFRLILEFCTKGSQYSLLYSPLTGLFELLIAVLAGSLTFFYGRARTKVDLSNCNSKFSIENIVNGLSCSWTLVFGVNILISLLQTIWNHLTGNSFYSPDFSMGSSTIYNICIGLSTLVVAPILEELLCRGVILRTLSKYNKTVAIIVSGCLFGMLHMNIIQGLPTALFGMVLAYVSLKYDSLILPMIIHAINNLVALILTNSIPVLSSYLTFIELGLAAYGIFLLAKELKSVQIDREDFRLIKFSLQQWTIILFIIFFIVSCVISLFGN